jgi:tetratricopeptide (TPR) repeat protein
MEPEFVEVYPKLGNIYYRQGEFDSAIFYHDKALQYDSLNEEARFERSYSRLQVSNYTGALQDAELLLKFGASDKNIPWIAGVSSANLRLFKQAEDYFNACLLKDSSDASVYRIRSIVRDSLGNTQGALSDLDQCIILDSTDARYYLDRGLLHLTKMGNIRQALRDYDKAIALKPGYAKAYYYRGLLYGRLFRDAEKACADMKRARDLGYLIDSEEYSEYCE